VHFGMPHPMHQLPRARPDEAANVFPIWRRSWNRKPSGSPASATHSGQRTDRWKLFCRNAAPFGALKIKSSGSLGGNSARCSGAAIASARPLFCRFGPDLSGLQVRQGAQPTCVGHCVPVSVVVEVGEDASTCPIHRGPPPGLCLSNKCRGRLVAPRPTAPNGDLTSMVNT